MYYIFLFAFKKVFGPTEIVFRYELYMKESPSEKALKGKYRSKFAYHIL